MKPMVAATFLFIVSVSLAAAQQVARANEGTVGVITGTEGGPMREPALI